MQQCCASFLIRYGMQNVLMSPGVAGIVPSFASAVQCHIVLC